MGLRGLQTRGHGTQLDASLIVDAHRAWRPLAGECSRSPVQEYQLRAESGSHGQHHGWSAGGVAVAGRERLLQDVQYRRRGKVADGCQAAPGNVCIAGSPHGPRTGCGNGCINSCCTG
jgi:hypothetical protein